MRTGKRFLCAFLGMALPFAVTVGCAQTAPTLEPELVEALQVSEAAQAELDQSIQTVNKTSTAENTKVHVRQTLGNERELYVLYDVTFEDDIDITLGEEDGILPKTAILSDKERVTTGTGGGGSVSPVAVDGQTITYLSYFKSSLDQWSGETRTFAVGNFEKSGPSETGPVAEDVHEITWTPTNQGTVLTGDILSESGEVIGSVSLSPFSLRFALDRSEQADTTDLLLTIALVGKDGEITKTRGGSVSGGVEEDHLSDLHGSLAFHTLLDLSEVSAVQIDGHTVSLEA